MEQTMHKFIILFSLVISMMLWIFSYNSVGDGGVGYGLFGFISFAMSLVYADKHKDKL